MHVALNPEWGTPWPTGLNPAFWVSSCPWGAAEWGKGFDVMQSEQLQFLSQEEDTLPDQIREEYMKAET